MKLIIGLGNPGKQYIKTRHNIGFGVVNSLQQGFDFPKFKLAKKLQAEISSGQIYDQKVILAQPQTFMNNSGIAIALLKQFYKIKPSDMIIVRDDIDLDFGQVRVKQASGSGGHNGINSIVEHLGTNEFTQIKIGIKNTSLEKIDPSKFVLANFTSSELKSLGQIKNEVLDVIKKELAG